MTKILALVASMIIVFVDQVTKYLAVKQIAPIGSKTIIPNLFNLTYIENRGAAFGILQGKTKLLSIVVLIVLAAAVYLIFSNRIKDKFFLWTMAVIIGGGLGNLVDRLRLGFVVDFLDFRALFNFPVFNFADCCVVIGAILMLIYVIRSDKILTNKED